MSLATLPRSKPRAVPPPVRIKERTAPNALQMQAILSKAAEELRERINANAESHSKAERERKRLLLLCAVNPRRFEQPLRLADKALRDAEHERDLLDLQEKELRAVIERLKASSTVKPLPPRGPGRFDVTGNLIESPEPKAIDEESFALHALWQRIGEAVK